VVPGRTQGPSRKIRACQEAWPFEVSAIVLLPDPLHAIGSLPPGDSNFPSRWGWIKMEFTKGGLEAQSAAAVRWKCARPARAMRVRLIARRDVV
jgi:REP element-mobilizing transposase RayT